ncbi:hypothetical protein BOX15_Mlig004811g1 [Macrostomum lignano]|uniref:Uncharacterized protein n=1 Tax=Macrostomum lignano TaxID=282301 RepID=A0A267FBW8_9PLAT|nr:hypothetical protein BOX15_Mlig004811g1 [Macrostomum lignano]
MMQFAIISSDTGEPNKNEPMAECLAAMLTATDACRRRLESVSVTAAAAASTTSCGPQSRCRLYRQRRSLQQQVARLRVEFHSIAKQFSGILGRIAKPLFNRGTEVCSANNNDVISTLDEASSDELEKQTARSAGSTDPTAADPASPGKIGFAIVKSLAESRRILDRLASDLLALPPDRNSRLARRRASTGSAKQRVVVRLSMRFHFRRESAPAGPVARRKILKAPLRPRSAQMQFGNIAFRRELGIDYPLTIGDAQLPQRKALQKCP